MKRPSCAASPEVPATTTTTSESAVVQVSVRFVDWLISRRKPGIHQRPDWLRSAIRVKSDRGCRRDDAPCTPRASAVPFRSGAPWRRHSAAFAASSSDLSFWMCSSMDFMETRLGLAPHYGGLPGRTAMVPNATFPEANVVAWPRSHGGCRQPQGASSLRSSQRSSASPIARINVASSTLSSVMSPSL